MSLIIYSGKTWYYRALQCSLNCVVVVLIPLVPLLEEAVQGAIDAGLRAVRMTDLYDTADIASALQGGCLVFCSFEAACNDITSAVLDQALEDAGAITVVDEAHMLRLDMRCGTLHTDARCDFQPHLQLSASLQRRMAAWSQVWPINAMDSFDGDHEAATGNSSRLLTQS
jgi:hypothetical protein